MGGIASTSHGAIIALMLEQVMGQLAAEVFGCHNIVTARLEVGFQRRLNMPRAFLAKAFMRGMRRKLKEGPLEWRGGGS